MVAGVAESGGGGAGAVASHDRRSGRGGLARVARVCAPLGWHDIGADCVSSNPSTAQTRWTTTTVGWRSYRRRADPRLVGPVLASPEWLAR